MKTMLRIALLVLPLVPVNAATLVVWAPGYPGDTEQAQETMDALAGAVVEAAGLRSGALAAVYHQTLEDGERALAAEGTVLALVPLPVLHRFGDAFDLEPLLVVVQESRARETWSLVAAKGKVRDAGSLSGFTIASLAGYAPGFVRDTALGSWGALPADAAIEFTPRIRSALRRASNGESVVVLADGAQSAALGMLSFADSLEVVATSPELPVSFLCRIGDRLPASELGRLEEGFLKLDDTDEGREVLATMRIVRFEVPSSGAGR